MPAKPPRSLESIKRKQLEDLARASVVDEAGALELKLAPHRADLKRLEELRKTIRGWYDTEPAGMTFSPHGDEYFAMVGACGFQTRIHDMLAVFQHAGEEEFLGACSLSLDALGSIVPSSLVSAVTAKEQTGPRSLALQPIRPAK